MPFCVQDKDVMTTG